MNSLERESTCEDDVLAVLTDAGIDNLHTFGELRTGTEKAVAVGALNSYGSLPGGIIPTGFARVDMLIDVSTHADDDATGAELRALVADVREAVFVDDILSLLNAASSYATYYGLDEGPSTIPAPEGRRRHAEITFTLTMRPSNSTTTTTTTTT